jgi:hypothetical protein
MSILVSCIVAATSFLLLFDSFSNPAKVLGLVGISSAAFVVPALLVLLFLRLRFDVRLPAWVLQPLQKLALPVVSVVTAALTVWDFYSPLNTVFAATRLHQSRLMLVTVFWLAVVLISQTNTWWKKYWQRVIALAPIVVYLICGLASMWPFNVYLELVKEDRVFEWAQFWVLFGGSIAAWATAWKLPAKQLWWKIFFVLAGAGFFLIAGDEISWGQRLLGLEVHESVQEVNRQGELTLHNLYIFEWAVLYVYALLSLAGSFSWLIEKTPLRKFSFLVPSKLLFGYFFLPFVYYAVQIYKIPHGLWHAWSEPLELYLYAGIVLWIALLGKNLLRK